MTDVVEVSIELPTVEQVAAVLAMCEAHDLPLNQLPNLWDKYQALQQVERRSGIQNGNQLRELERLRASIKELEQRANDAELQAQLYRTRVEDLEETEGKLTARVKELEALGLDGASLLRQITALESRIEQDGIAYSDLTDKYEALRLRCKHFESAADPKRIEDLEDLLAHYRSGMEGMKQLADIKHFSNEWRLWLIRRTLNVFEPQLKGKHHA